MIESCLWRCTPAGIGQRCFHLAETPRGVRIRLLVLLQAQTTVLLLLLWEKGLLDGPLPTWAHDARQRARPSYLRLRPARAAADDGDATAAAPRREDITKCIHKKGAGRA